jgi:hypothetical protein
VIHGGGSEHQDIRHVKATQPASSLSQTPRPRALVTPRVDATEPGRLIRDVPAADGGLAAGAPLPIPDPAVPATAPRPRTIIVIRTMPFRSG